MQMRTWVKSRQLFCALALVAESGCGVGLAQDVADSGRRDSQVMTKQAAKVTAQTEEILRILKADAGRKPDAKTGAKSKPDVVKPDKPKH